VVGSADKVKVGFGSAGAKAKESRVSMIYVKVKPGRRAYYEGKALPSDRFVPVIDSPYIRRLIDHHQDLETEGGAEGKPAPAPRPERQSPDPDSGPPPAPRPTNPRPVADRDSEGTKKA
jgi:hypothetical protein